MQSQRGSCLTQHAANVEVTSARWPQVAVVTGVRRCATAALPQLSSQASKGLPEQTAEVLPQPQVLSPTLLMLLLMLALQPVMMYMQSAPAIPPRTLALVLLHSCPLPLC